MHVWYFCSHVSEQGEETLLYQTSRKSSLTRLLTPTSEPRTDQNNNLTSSIGGNNGGLVGVNNMSVGEGLLPRAGGTQMSLHH